MLLNNFLYLRSLKKNELSQKNKSFSTLVPKSTFNNPLSELFDFEKKDDYHEEKRNIKLKGGKEKKEEGLTELGILWAKAASEDMKVRETKQQKEDIPKK